MTTLFALLLWTVPMGPAEDRQPPVSLEAERSVLGGILLDPPLVHEVSGFLRPSDFFRDSHEEIFSVLCDMAARGVPIDTVTLADELEGRGKLAFVGGYEALGEIVGSVPHAVNTRYWAEIVRNKAIVRDLIAVSGTIERDCYSLTYRADELIDRAEGAVLAIRGPRSGSELVPAGDAALEAMTEILSRQDGQGLGLSTGFRKLDRAIGGFQGGMTYVIGARPSMGKTALALNVADHVALDQSLPTLFFSLEMGHRLLLTRVLQARARVDGDAVRGDRRLTPDEMTRLSREYERQRSSRLVIHGDMVQTASDVVAAVRRMKHRGGVSLVVVDYLQLLEGGDQDGENWQQKVAKASRAFKNLAVALDVPVVILSQLSRAVENREDRRPRMSDLRDSGGIEQDADVVMLLYRHDYYHPGERAGEVDVHIAKNRNGPTGVVNMRFVRDQTRFEELDQDVIGPDF